ncbi:hypothetical protein HYN48_06815 [Flavobacterium magnum]|uniref:Uncharacterized protein n=1 Tax=Flavobacterium magnum TaxID=2162713 RepID=A0A2S0REU5_9FLAO|nr:hypothetical protein [Flavobacterium magnum]AWA29810.1 hypothetical protein HYN48_06815 [Flavobacterium magnum]
MKKIMLIICLLTLNLGYSKVFPVAVKYKDGHEENGFMENIMQKKIDLLGFGSWEHTYNLDAKVLKIRDSEKGNARKVSVKDIDYVIFHFEKGDLEYKAIRLMRIGGGGKLNDDGIYLLPVVRKGLINIYGFTFVHTEPGNPADRFSRDITVREYFFYYQNPKMDYAIDYLNTTDILTFISLRKKVALPLTDLFKDCPQMTAEIEKATADGTTSRQERKQAWKESEAKQAELDSEFSKLTEGQKISDLDTYHKYDRDFMEQFIVKYGEFCPETK